MPGRAINHRIILRIVNTQWKRKYTQKKLLQVDRIEFCIHRTVHATSDELPHTDFIMTCKFLSSKDQSRMFGLYFCVVNGKHSVQNCASFRLTNFMPFCSATRKFILYWNESKLSLNSVGKFPKKKSRQKFSMFCRIPLTIFDVLYFDAIKACLCIQSRRNQCDSHSLIRSGQKLTKNLRACIPHDCVYAIWLDSLMEFMLQTNCSWLY